MARCVKSGEKTRTAKTMVCNKCKVRKNLSGFAERQWNCRECQKEINKAYYEKRKAEGKNWKYYEKYDYVPRRITIDWCPRDEWPRLRRFNYGHFRQMLEDGILTPGMHVTQHDKQYIVWGPQGEQQWMTRI